MRILHLVPIILIIASVMAALKADDVKAFTREFLKTAGSLFGGFAGLAIIVLLLGWLF